MHEPKLNRDCHRAAGSHCCQQPQQADGVRSTPRVGACGHGGFRLRKLEFRRKLSQHGDYVRSLNRWQLKHFNFFDATPVKDAHDLASTPEAFQVFIREKT